MPAEGLKTTSNSAGARLAIRLLQDAAENGDIDPWDIDVIPVIDGFLDQLRQRIDLPKRCLSNSGGTFENDLADSSEAFLAASVLVSLKAEVLETDTFPPEAEDEDTFDLDFSEQGWLDPRLNIPRNPERHLYRRPVAPPPLRRAVSLGELIEQLESIAETIEADELLSRRRRRDKRFSEKQIIEQVTSLAHREKLPETTAALGVFLNNWEQALNWVDFDALVINWEDVASSDLDRDRVGVFWALLFLSSQGKIELKQEGFLYAPLRLRRILEPGMIAQLPLNTSDVTASSPAAA
ncbi:MULTISPECIES: segregation/condensation protein A [Prochlorococcus]|uniref:Segregation and condensation protein A n=1 Tax=Prochlorococcus marinus (strain SARG / CCMP1375 / SS120) TaxID=167539 RepID=Q7VE40_PROMA|nr:MULTISPECIES: segregation/condensation protein A [Prochlorococcus]AAP99220.1 Uncharacterized conserved protein [Prochlorococcus marinus subsp. marinus str. CCMP1375]KGG11512.1 Segregation and condensation protein A [Prochlorococcus marinus str. LG]KGG18534.1 Segregation and condensation protein A [Prochlorococcus marinus str. SS2]KGG22807.1 Segregation and condensation protein A [Prochlorococcus marinus str. SS35]KGG32684.1 Segregation and condensation protein A [Prochlorococcus marinus str